MSNLRWKVVTIIAVFVIFFGLGVYPLIAQRYGIQQPSWLVDKALKLGLDLKGGVHLVLRVQTEDALRLVTDQETERLREQLKTKNIPFTKLEAPDATHIRVEGIPPAQDAAFRQVGNEVSTNFERGSAANGSYTFTMRPNIQVNLRDEAVVQARQTIERRVNELGVAEPQIAQQGANGDQIMVQLPGVSDVERAKGIIQSTGKLDLKIVEQGPSPTRESLLVNGQVPSGMEIVPGSSGSAGDSGTSFYICFVWPGIEPCISCSVFLDIIDDSGLVNDRHIVGSIDIIIIDVRSSKILSRYKCPPVIWQIITTGICQFNANTRPDGRPSIIVI